MTDPDNPDNLKRITEIWAWVCTEKHGGEGVPAYTTYDGTVVPMMGADEARARSLSDMAHRICEMFDVPVRLVRFTHLEEMGE